MIRRTASQSESCLDAFVLATSVVAKAHRFGSCDIVQYQAVLKVTFCAIALGAGKEASRRKRDGNCEGGRTGEAHTLSWNVRLFLDPRLVPAVWPPPSSELVISRRKAVSGYSFLKSSSSSTRISSAP